MKPSRIYTINENGLIEWIIKDLSYEYMFKNCGVVLE